MEMEDSYPIVVTPAPSTPESLVVGADGSKTNNLHPDLERLWHGRLSSRRIHPSEESQLLKNHDRDHRHRDLDQVCPCSFTATNSNCCCYYFLQFVVTVVIVVVLMVASGLILQCALFSLPFITRTRQQRRLLSLVGIKPLVPHKLFVYAA